MSKTMVMITRESHKVWKYRIWEDGDVVFVAKVLATQYSVVTLRNGCTRIAVI